MKRIISLVVVAVLLLGILPVSAAGDAMKESNLKKLVNSVTLKSQRSGYLQVDVLPEEIFAPYAKSDGIVLGLSGAYPIGKCTLTAVGTGEFLGWYDEKATLLSREKQYIFLMENGKTLYRVFQGEYFRDVAGQWYEADTNAAHVLGLVEGVGEFRFYAKGTMSRAIALTVLYRIANPEEKAPVANYTDVDRNSRYAEAVDWGTYVDAVKGVGNGHFNPNGAVTREQLLP